VTTRRAHCGSLHANTNNPRRPHRKRIAAPQGSPRATPADHLRPGGAPGILVRTMAEPKASPPTQLAKSQAADLLPVVYENLRQLAARLLGQDAGRATLQATALVNEAFVRLNSSRGSAGWESPEHFLAAAARTMRCILVDSHRRKGRLHRYIAEGHVGTPEARLDVPQLDLIAVDDALNQLAAEDATAARVVEFRFFAGLSVAQTATALGISRRAVSDKWSFARAWLQVVLEGDEDPDPKRPG
jgi:RNA polymerase sigma factor (TIGR02999 family)